MKYNLLNVCCFLSLLSAGCSTMNETQVRDLNRMADHTVAKMVFEQPGLQAVLGAAAGAIAFEWTVSKIPMVGKRGEGVLIDQSSNERTSVTITNLEIDGADGVGGYIGLMVIKDQESFSRAKTEGLSLENRGTIYIYVEGESSAVYPVKRITIEPK